MKRLISVLCIGLMLFLAVPARATVSSTTNKIIYIGDNSTTVFPYNFKVFASTDLVVTLVVTSTGVETTQTITTHYTVSGVGVASGGNVTMVTSPTTLQKLVIRRVMPLTQGLDLVDNTATSVENYEDAYDKIVMMVQQSDEVLNRTIKAGLTSTSDLNLPSPVAGKAIGWNASAELDNIDVGIEVGTIGGTTNVIAASSYSTLVAAVAAIGSSEKTLFIDTIEALEADLTIPDNISVVMTYPGIINIALGNTLTINGPLEAGIYQIFSGTGTVAFGSGAVNEVYPEWWGSFPGLTTDTSTAFNQAINLGIKVRLQPGVYLVNAVHATGFLVIEGSGIRSTFLKSYTATGYAWAENMASTLWTSHLVMSDLSFTGTSGKTRNGFVFGDPTTYTTSIELAGRVVLNNVGFYQLNIGFHKSYGNIGNTLNNCDFTALKYGIYAVGRAGAMHIGADTYNKCMFDGCDLAGVYFDTVLGSVGQNIFNSCIFEANAGFGIFVYDYGTGFSPLVINEAWFESNAGSVSVTINGVSYTPRDMYFRNAPVAIVNNSGDISSIEIVTSTLYVNDCTLYPSAPFAFALTKDVYSTATFTNSPGAISPIFGIGDSVGPRLKKTSSYTENLINAESFANSDIYGWTGGGGNSAIVNDGVLFDSCQEITLANGVLAQGPAITLPTNKYIVYSIDLKLITAISAGLNIALSSGTTIGGALGTDLIQDTWITKGGIASMFGVTSSTISVRIENGTGAPATVRVSALQVLSFDTKQEALFYLNSKLYCMGTAETKVVYSTVSPTTGTWGVGDRCFNNVPVIGQPKSWTCTVAGTPGTWVSEGNL